MATYCKRQYLYRATESLARLRHTWKGVPSANRLGFKWASVSDKWVRNWVNNAPPSGSGASGNASLKPVQQAVRPAGVRGSRTHLRTRSRPYNGFAVRPAPARQCLLLCCHSYAIPPTFSKIRWTVLPWLSDWLLENSHIPINCILPYSPVGW